MARPNEKLAESLDALKALQEGGGRVFRSVRIPSHGEHHSDAMANTVPRSWRTAFRHDGEHDSEVMASSVPI